MFGVSEALGHLDLLEDDALLTRSADQPIRYCAA